MSNNFNNNTNDPFPNNYNGPGYSNAGEPNVKGKKSKKDKKTTKKVVSLNKKLALLFSVLAALFAIVITSSSNSTIYVARTINPVSSFDTLSLSNIEFIKLEKTSIEPDTFSGSSKNELTSDVEKIIAINRTNTNLNAHQQLRKSFFSTSIQTKTPLLPDERLISIGARPSASVIGTVKPGDKVDIYASTSNGLSGMIGSNIEVVSVSISADQLDNVSQQQLTEKGKKLSDLVPAYPVPGTYVLRIKASEVSKFVAIDSGAKVYLILRGADAVDAPLDAIDPVDAICSGARSSSSSCVKNNK